MFNMKNSNGISREEIEKLANLARIKISEEEKESMRTDIEAILEYVGHVKAVSTDGIQEVPVLRNVMRDDAVTHHSAEFTESLLALAPSRDGNYLKVKKILQ